MKLKGRTITWPVAVRRKPKNAKPTPEPNAAGAETTPSRIGSAGPEEPLDPRAWVSQKSRRNSIIDRIF